MSRYSAAIELWCMHDQEHIDARFRYDTRDPLAITMEFAGYPEKTWSFARELLRKGLTRLVDNPAGEGDVKIGSAPAYVAITLESPDGCVLLCADKGDVRFFLDATYQLFSAESEQRWHCAPDDLSGLLAGGGA